MDAKRKKLLYQSWHRGCKETDKVLGPFAEFFLPQCSDAELSAFSLLLEEDDWDIWRWITQPDTVPRRHASLVENILLSRQALLP